MRFEIADPIAWENHLLVPLKEPEGNQETNSAKLIDQCMDQNQNVCHHLQADINGGKDALNSSVKLMDMSIMHFLLDH